MKPGRLTAGGIPNNSKCKELDGPGDIMAQQKPGASKQMKWLKLSYIEYPVRGETPLHGE